MSFLARLGALLDGRRRTARPAGHETSHVIGIEVVDRRTALMCDGPNGPTTVLVNAVPTGDQAARWRSLVRIHLVDIVVDGPVTTATLHGVGHRLPTRRLVPISVGLSLLADGVAVNVSFVDRSSPNTRNDD